MDEAQENKLKLVCRKLDLQPGMRVLDIGCGWGGTAKFAAEHYKVEVVGITVSEKQVQFGTELCSGLPVEIRLQDYRNLKGTFDRILSIGMFEHVGYKNYITFLRVVNRCLKDVGVLEHCPKSVFEHAPEVKSWLISVIPNNGIYLGDMWLK